MKPRVELTALLSHLTQEFNAVSELKQLEEGEESRAFSFRSGQDDLIARLNFSALGFLKDKLAGDRFHASALPVPQILSVGRFSGFSICISRRSEGITLQDMGAPPVAVLAAVMATLETLACADVSFTRGFGPFSEHGVATWGSWQDFLLSPKRFNWPATSAVLDQSKIAALLVELERLARHCPETRGLVHGDFGSNNVLISDDRITGVIDWSEALIGDPYYDLANIFFWRHWLPCMAAQANYAEALGILPDIKRRLVCYQLHIGLQEAFSSAISGNTEMANWAMARSVELI